MIEWEVEVWPSGWRRTTRNRVGSNVSEVRILSLPPGSKNDPTGLFLFLQETRIRAQVRMERSDIPSSSRFRQEVKNDPWGLFLFHLKRGFEPRFAWSEVTSPHPFASRRYEKNDPWGLFLFLKNEEYSYSSFQIAWDYSLPLPVKTAPKVLRRILISDAILQWSM